MSCLIEKYFKPATGERFLWQAFVLCFVWERERIDQSRQQDAKARIELGKYEPVHGFVRGLKKSNSFGLKCRIVQYSYIRFSSAASQTLISGGYNLSI